MADDDRGTQPPMPSNPSTPATCSTLAAPPAPSMGALLAAGDAARALYTPPPRPAPDDHVGTGDGHPDPAGDDRGDHRDAA